MTLLDTFSPRSSSLLMAGLGYCCFRKIAFHGDTGWYGRHIMDAHRHVVEPGSKVRIHRKIKPNTPTFRKER